MAGNTNAFHSSPAMPIVSAASAVGDNLAKFVGNNGHFNDNIATSGSGDGMSINQIQPAHHLAPVAPTRQADNYDDRLLLKQIQATHALDPTKRIDIPQLLEAIDDILRNANSAIQTSPYSQQQIDEEVALVIERLSCQISCNARFGEDAHKATMSILEHVGSYDWNYKMVLTLAAFVSTYGELWLLVQTYRNKNKLAQSIVTLKQFNIMDKSEKRFAQDQFVELTKLIQEMRNATDYAIKFKDLLGSKYITEDAEPYSKAMGFLQQAAYWTIKSSMVSVTQIFDYAAKGDRIEASELSTYTQKLGFLLNQLETQWQACDAYIGAKKFDEEYDELVKCIQQGCSDNLYVLERLICSQSEKLIYSFAKQDTVEISQVLAKKTVLLLVTGSEIAKHDISVLRNIYETEHEFEVVWVPIVENWNDGMRPEREDMPWYMMNKPASMKKVVIKFIKEQWRFTNNTILVALSSRAQMLSLDAFDLIRIWGCQAFPFSKVHQGNLWDSASWGLDFLFPFPDGKRLIGVYETNETNEYICWFGGDNLTWVNEFLELTPKIEQKWSIKIKLVYLGKKTRSSPEVAEVIKRIEGTEHHYVEDFALSFWAKLESIQFSMFQVPSTHIKERMREEVTRLISYSKHSGWAVFSKGPKLLNILDTATMLSFLKTYEEWEKQDSFASSFEARYSNNPPASGTTHVCYTIEFPVACNKLEVENFKCPDCKKPMPEYRSFHCCH